MLRKEEKPFILLLRSSEDVSTGGEEGSVEEDLWLLTMLVFLRKEACSLS